VVELGRATSTPRVRRDAGGSTTALTSMWGGQKERSLFDLVEPGTVDERLAAIDEDTTAIFWG